MSQLKLLKRKKKNTKHKILLPIYYFSFSSHSEVVQTHIEFLEVHCFILFSILPLWLANAIILSFSLGLIPSFIYPFFYQQ